ncbi:MAG: heme-dependent oxidative N-demethylase family protein [Acidimicrobiales bacterium]
MAGRPIPAEYCTFDSRPFRWRMGLRRLDSDSWLELDDEWAADIEEKRRLLDQRRNDVFAALPGSEAACVEIAEAVFAFVREQRLEPEPDPSEHPLVRAALAVQEDLLVMQRHQRAWFLTAGSLSFPTNWHLGEKMGRDLDQIHAPVPRYQEHLGGAVPDFFDRLRVEKPMWRANWSITDDPGLRLEPELRIRSNHTMTPDEAAYQLHLRVERQTFRRFPETDAVLFTVRIHRQPVAWLAKEPEMAGRLAGALAELPDDVGAYKDSTSRWAEPLITWLRQVSSDT